jgi:sugar phosphate isomerase/epimerase
MQALLFGTTGLNVFGPAAVQDAMLDHLTAVCRIGAGLGATRLVFGSPKNRDRTGLDDAQALAVAVPFFRRLGDIARHQGVVVCLEPNPSCYGANFMTTSPETAFVVEQIAHPAILMQLDTGAITINKEDFLAIVHNYSHLIGHIHASEPSLLPLGDGGTDHAKVADSLLKHLPNHVVSIEMLATVSEPHAVSIARACGVASKHYREPGLVDV